MKNSFYDNSILSISGWRGVFALSGDEQDTSPEISHDAELFSFLAAKAFCVLLGDGKKILVARDTRPTGKAICAAMLKALCRCQRVEFLDVASVCEVVSYGKNFDGFIYVSASHNPIGHNGIKFGLNSGGVLDEENSKHLIEIFRNLMEDDNAVNEARTQLSQISHEKLEVFCKGVEENKHKSEKCYENFIKEVIWNTTEKEKQNEFEKQLRTFIQDTAIKIVCDFNGSARGKSIDKSFIESFGIDFIAVNEEKIVHEIIPEGDNLKTCGDKIEEAASSHTLTFGYVPDCDGDRGNVVFYNEKTKKAEIIDAQTVFALCVYSELLYCKKFFSGHKTAVVVNDATSMRCEKIAEMCDASLFRSEVGEANVVGLAEDVRKKGFSVRIAGEGSNGGNITYPSCVRDPLATVFSILKLLAFSQKNLSDCISVVPKYITTGVSHELAKLEIGNISHSKLKTNYQKIFLEKWKSEEKFFHDLGIFSFSAVTYNGKISRDLTHEDFGLSDTGGFKIIFYDRQGCKKAFIWMRGSRTEKIFRVMCDVEGEKIETHNALLLLHREMITAACSLG